MFLFAFVQESLGVSLAFGEKSFGFHFRGQRRWHFDTKWKILMHFYSSRRGHLEKLEITLKLLNQWMVTKMKSYHNSNIFIFYYWPSLPFCNNFVINISFYHSSWKPFSNSFIKFSNSSSDIEFMPNFSFEHLTINLFLLRELNKI